MQLLQNGQAYEQKKKWIKCPFYKAESLVRLTPDMCVSVDSTKIVPNDLYFKIKTSTFT